MNTATALIDNVIQFPTPAKDEPSREDLLREITLLKEQNELLKKPVAHKDKEIKVGHDKVHEPVEPIRSIEDVEAAKAYLRNKPKTSKNLRNYMMFVVNINNAVRISDLFQLRIKDVLNKDGSIVDRVYIEESKTGKKRYIFFGEASKKAIRAYLKSLKRFKWNDHLFSSLKRDGNGNTKPLTRQMAWEIMQELGRAISTEKKKYHLGTHSMRKTFGYLKIQQYPDDTMIVAQISEMYNHKNMNTTYRYLGIDTEVKEQLCTANEL